MNRKAGYRIEWFAALCLFIIFYIVYSNNNQALIVFGSIFIVFLVYALFQRGVFSFRFDGYYLYILVFCAFCYLSALWAEKRSLSISKGNLMVQIFLGMFVLYLIFKDSINLSGILKMIMWGNYCILGYAILRYGWRTFIDALQSGMRISNDFLNANVLGMCAAYAVIINLYLFLYERRRITDFLMIPVILILVATGSRTATIILIIGILALFILKNFDNKHFLRSLFIIITIVAVFLLVLFLLFQLPIFDSVTDRLSSLFILLTGGGNRGTSGWLRLQYIRLGWNLFKEHPILGIGIDNAKLYALNIYGLEQYLHNNYAELAACGGILGFAIYYSIYVYIFYILIKYRSERDREWDICLILLILRLIAEMGTVSYQTRGTYVYLLLFWLEAQKLKKKEKLPIN